MPTCPDCGGFQPTGCTCAFDSSDSFDLTPSVASLTSIAPAARIASDPNNLVEDFSGLRAPPGDYQNKPRVRLTTLSAITIFYAIDKVLVFDDLVYDTDGMEHQGRIRAVRRGLHLLGVELDCSPSTGLLGRFRVMLRLNGDRVIGDHEVPMTQDGADSIVAFWAETFMEVGDWVDVYAVNVNDSATNITVLRGTNTGPVFWGNWLRDGM